MSKDTLVFLSEKFSPFRKKFLFSAHRTRDDFYWKQLFENKKRSWLAKGQTINAQEHIDQGSDLAAARFVIGRMRGRIQDDRGIWINKMKDLPANYIKNFKVIAIDASNSSLMSEGTDNFAGLEHLKSLNISSNKYIDDFACDQISREFRKSKCLEAIDLSHIEQVSVNGLNILFRIPSIKLIRAVDTGASRSDEIDLFLLAAEGEKNCRIVVSEDQEKEEELTKMLPASERLLLNSSSSSSQS